MSREEQHKKFEDDSTMSWDAKKVSAGGEHLPPRQRKHPDHRKGKKNSLYGKTYFLTILVISCILASMMWLMCNDLLALNKKDRSAEIVVTADSSISQVAKSLKDAKLIQFKGLFLLYSSMSDTEIAEGTYTLDSEMDYHALLTAMSKRSGVRATANVTIPEGYSMKQIFEVLEEKNVNSAEELMDAAANADFDYEFLEGKEKGNPSRLEGYLFPDTYQFYCGGKPEDVLDKMLQNFNKKLDENLMKAVNNSSYSLDEIITIASLIEKETDGSDDSKIASVIRNRMRNSGETAGYLQIDAALLYALPEHKEVLTDADKEIDSPYNLYKHKGLPPTPIANPGISSIRAALYPDDTDYYFYALGDDDVHHFFRTYSEHLEFLDSLKD